MSGTSLSFLLALAAVVTLGANACGGTITSPSTEGPLRITDQISQSVLAHGESTTITFRLENTGTESVKLSFSSTCQVMPYIDDARAAATVYPAGGGWVCAMMITSLVLPPGGVSVREVQVRAADTAPYPYVALPPGGYGAYVKVEDFTYKLRSKSVAFTVR